MSKRMEGSVLIEANDHETKTGLVERAASVDRTELCSNCVHATDCAFRRFSHRPVVHCEEWSVGIASVELTEESGKRVRPAAKVVEPGPRPPGLCATCEEYPNCTFDKPSSGVWHCEEYR